MYLTDESYQTHRLPLGNQIGFPEHANRARVLASDCIYVDAVLVSLTAIPVDQVPTS